MAEIAITGNGSPLSELTERDDFSKIDPGSELSYNLAKAIYEYHPLGAKMAENPIAIAQSQVREISIQDAPEDVVREQFLDTWKDMQIDRHIFGVATLARVYGAAAVIHGIVGFEPGRVATVADIQKGENFFNVLDPLNTASGNGLSQDPNSPLFQTPMRGLSVQGQNYNVSRCSILYNGSPIYLSYTTSAFGYVGRSVYQRALYPLKSFLQSMKTDQLVMVKAGVIVEKTAGTQSVADRIGFKSRQVKANITKQAATGNVLSIGPDDEISSLDLHNLEGPAAQARKNILENVATGADMPAKIINNETFAEGFGEGTEDAKNVARYIERQRVWMQPVYDFFDRIVQAKAWTPEFYLAVQAQFPDLYSGVDYKTAFVQWQNGFTANWPSLLIEPESEKVKTDDVKLKALIATLQVLLPEVKDPENKARVIEFFVDNINENKRMFTAPLELDYEALIDHFQNEIDNQQQMQEAQLAAPKPFSGEA